MNDIVHEVEKQLESLKRQASKARRYRALREEMQGVERVLFGRRFLELEEQLARARASASRAEAEREQRRVASPSRPKRRRWRRGAARSTRRRRALEEVRGAARTS